MPSDGNPSFYHLWAVMDFHPKSLVMDIHAPSGLVSPPPKSKPQPNAQSIPNEQTLKTHILFENGDLIPMLNRLVFHSRIEIKFVMKM